MRILGALCIVLCATPWTAQAQDSAPPTVHVRPGDDVQALVDANPPGTSFVFTAGEYRTGEIIPKLGNLFLSWEGAVLNGSELLGYSFRYGRLWAFPNLPRAGDRRGECAPATPHCQYPEDLFYDDVPLPRAASIDETGPGQWYFDYDDQKVYLGNDPEGHKVELGTRSFAIAGEASNVTIRGLRIEKYAAPAQAAAVEARGRNWTVQGNEIRLNHGWGVKIGPGLNLAGNRINDNGQLGVGGTAEDVLVEGNEIAGNNYAGFEPGWEAGGTKFFATRNLRVRGNYVCRNRGTGLWTDTDNLSVFYEDNTVTDNMGPGIQHEISFNALIARNVLRGNGKGGSDWLWGAQIQIQNSRDVEVTGNQVEIAGDVGNGISIIQQDRGGYPAVNIYVHHNDITHWAARGQNGAVADYQNDAMFRGNNRFDYNAYHTPHPGAMHWAWQDSYRTWDGFRGLGQEANGTIDASVPPAGLKAAMRIEGMQVAPSVCAQQ